ncbi:MAG: sugar ABC transporter permease [bacterium]
MNKNKYGGTAFLFLLPFLVAFILFRLGPVIGGFMISLTEWNIVGAPKFIGIANYTRLMHDPAFWTAMVNTLYFVGMSVPLLVGLGLGLALLYNQPAKSAVFGRVATFAPYVMMPTVVGLLWKWIYDTRFGLLNYYLVKLHIPAIPWLTDVNMAMPAVVIATLWWNVGYTMVIFLAGLQDIPEELYEAARIDGAGRWGCFRHVTLPLLKPTTFFIIVITLINSFQVFDQVFVMTNGGPLSRTITLVQYLYKVGFQDYQLGYASAVAYILFLMLMILAMVQLKYFFVKGEAK